jgi:hypothetical protein
MNVYEFMRDHVAKNDENLTRHFLIAVFNASESSFVQN